MRFAGVRCRVSEPRRSAAVPRRPGPSRAAADRRPPAQVWCRCITAVFNYFVVTNFFWMFAEGCYLHTAIVMTYSTERLRKWLFLFIGWCESPGGGRLSRAGEGALPTRSPPGGRTGPQPHPPSPGQSEGAVASLHAGEEEANRPSKRTFRKQPSSWNGRPEDLCPWL